MVRNLRRHPGHLLRAQEERHRRHRRRQFLREPGQRGGTDPAEQHPRGQDRGSVRGFVPVAARDVLARWHAGRQGDSRRAVVHPDRADHRHHVRHRPGGEFLVAQPRESADRREHRVEPEPRQHAAEGNASASPLREEPDAQDVRRVRSDGGVREGTAQQGQLHPGRVGEERQDRRQHRRPAVQGHRHRVRADAG